MRSWLSTAELHGARHEGIGQLAAVSERDVAIALSIGGARKTYEHVDPNEDSAGFAIAPDGRFAVVADGHHGRDAAQTAVEVLLRDFAPRWTGPDFSVAAGEAWDSAARDAIADVQMEILAAVTRGARDTACTTLSFALVRPAQRLVAFGSIGDSHIFRAGPIEAVDMALHADPHAHFLGVPSDDRRSLVEKCVVGVEELDDAHAVVLATDGLSERGIGVEVPEITVFDEVAAALGAPADLRALVAARRVAEAASEAQRRHRAGDNIATAAIWIGA